MKKHIKNDFTTLQNEIIKTTSHLLTATDLSQIIQQKKTAAELDNAELVEFLTLTNLFYRQGEPIISDQEYDFIYLAELRRREPQHPFLLEVEPEDLSIATLESNKTVTLPTRMLSTDKAYDFQTIERWAKRIKKSTIELEKDFRTLEFRITPKLDGYAAYDDGRHLYTRGDGRRGTDITRAFERGLQIAESGKRGLGAGEIVVSKSWFTQRLAENFENSRNVQAALIKEKELDPLAEETLLKGKAVFFPFTLLPDWRGKWSELCNERDFLSIVEKLWHTLDYDTDGIVIEITDSEVKEAMGATRHHHRWQIAYKQNSETVEVKIDRVIPQTSRSGRVNPVVEFTPTRLRGAVIRRATAHHYAMVREQKIGKGAVILLSRSGEVIPKIEEVLQSGIVDIPKTCPSCEGKLDWDGEWIICTNHLYCPAQIVNGMEHFFRTLGNIDGFGPSSLAKIYTGRVNTLLKIYECGEGDFQRLGFGPKQAENMVNQLTRSLQEGIEEWRFLAAFGIHRMGLGNCEKLLSFYTLKEIFTLREKQIAEIHGFAGKTAQEMVLGLARIKEEFWQLHRLGFTLFETKKIVEANTTEQQVHQSAIAGKTVVFTGAMQKGSRKEMEKEAKELGATIGSAISGKTDILICGAKVGSTKITKAEKLGILRIDEDAYLQLIAEK